MATIIDSILSEAYTGSPTKDNHCCCGSCAHCRSSQPTPYRNWRQRRNARYFGGSGPGGGPANPTAPNSRGLASPSYEGEITRVKNTPPVARKSIPGAASRIIPIRGAKKQGLLKKWTNKMQSAAHPPIRDRYARYAETIRNNERPGPDQSEKDLLPLFRRPGMLFYRPGKVIQILNYNIQSPHALIRLLGRKARMKNKPLIVLDLRGQENGAGSLLRLADRLAGRSGYPAGKIKIVTW